MIKNKPWETRVFLLVVEKDSLSYDFNYYVGLSLLENILWGILIMAIPDYQTIMLPLLKLASDGKEHSLKETYDKISDQFGLTEEERRELLPSGTQAIINNRIVWARTYLKKAGLLENPKRGIFKITERVKNF